MNSSSPLRGLVLTLFMALLVLMALFWFLYRGWGPLEEQAQQADSRSTRIADFEDELRQKNDSLSIVQATGTAVSQERDTAIANHQLAEKDIIAQQEANNLLLTRVFTQEMMLESQPVVTPSPPQVTILAPAAGSIAQLGAPLTVSAVAADGMGLASVLMAHDGQVVTQTLAGETLRVVETEWTPQAEGDFTVAVTAVNVAQISSQVVSVTIQIQDVAAETAAFQQTIAEILGAPASGSGAINAQPQAVPGNGGDSAANLLFLRAFDFPLPGGDVDVSRLGQYCQLTAVSPPANPLESPDAQLAAIRAIVRQQQLEAHDLGGRETAVANQDARAALCALAEGQIRLVQELFIARAAPELRAELQASLDNGLEIMPGVAPEIINEQQLFPTAEGLAFVRGLYELNGDLSAVNAAWQRLPQSSQHIMHLETYQADEMPQTVALPALVGVLPPDWALAGEGVLGEWLVGQYLSQEVDVETAVSAAAGWAGDSYAIYNNPADELVMVWQAAWNSPEAAQLFVENYDVYLTGLLGAPGLLEQIGTSSVRCWDGRAEAVCLYPAELPGRQDTVVVRAPDKAIARDVLDFVLAEAALD